MELHIANLQQQTTQWCPDAMSTSPTSWTPSLLSDIESEPHRQSFNNWEEGHFIGDCNREYRYDGEQYVPIVGEENLMELTYVVDRDYYQREHPRLQARP